MKPRLSIAIFLLLTLIAFLIFCFLYDSGINFFENFKIEPATAGDFYALVGTQQEILSLQVSKGEIKQYELFKRDGSDLLPKEFILVKKEECNEKK